MVARVTLAEIDVVRMSVASALELYRESVLTAQHQQPGYEGGYLFSTPEGKALVITFWATAADADAGLASGFYGEQVGKFATIFRSPPGRELYDVSIAEPPSAATAEPASAATAEAAVGRLPAGAQGRPSAGAQQADGHPGSG